MFRRTAPCRRSAALFAFVLLYGCSDRSQLYEFDGLAMASTWSVKVASSALPRGRGEIQQAIAAILDGVDYSMSTYKADSELSRLNRNPSTDWIGVSPALLAILTTAQKVSELSDGAFDVTVGPLVNLWGFGPDGRRYTVPSDAEIAAAKARVGWRNLEIDPARRAVRKHVPDLYVDLSAIAQGFAADEVGAYLDGIGVHDYLVDISGDLRASGVNEQGRPWRIGIERPGNAAPVVERAVEIRNAALATSGDYRNYFEQDGVRYSHEIDPATGRPIAHTLASASVIHASATWADALATALLVMGPERALALAEKKKLAVFLIIRSGSGFQEARSDRWTRMTQSLHGP